MDEVTFEQVHHDIGELTFEVRRVHEGRDLAPPDLSFERIIVGVDDSKGAQHAIAWANAIAPISDARVWLIHVAPSSSLAGPYETRGWVNAEAHSRRLEGQAAELLEQAAEQMDDAIDTETRLVHGSPSHQIEHLADEVGADLIIVGSHDHGAAGRVFLGSTADALKDRTTASLLVARDEPPAKRLLVATDGSEPSTRAAAIGLSLARRWKASLHLLHVFPLPVYTLEGGTEPVEKAFFKKAIDWAYEDLDREIRFGEDTPGEILDVADAHGSDLIVMGRRGLGPWRGRLAGSVSRRVLHGATTSVLLVTADEASD